MGARTLDTPWWADQISSAGPLVLFRNGPVCAVDHVFGLRGAKPSPLQREGVVRVVLSGLFGQVEVPTTSRIRADTRDVLPIAVVTAHVIINELLLKECCPVPPIETQLMDETGRGDLATPVAHPARGHKLSHECVNKGIVGVAGAPAGKVAGLEGGQQSPAGATTLAKKGLSIDHGAPVKELSPQQLKVQPVGGLIGEMFPFVTENRVGHCARRQGPARQPR